MDVDMDRDLWQRHIPSRAAQNRLRAAETWLARSGALPVSIMFRCRTHEPATIISAALETLLSHRARWQYADITLPAASPVSELETGARLVMPLLRKLHVTGASFDTDQCLALLSAPNLHTLVGQLADDTYYSKMRTLRLADADIWQTRSLTTLKLCEIALTYVAPILARTPALAHCWLDIWGWPPAGAGAALPVIHLPKLETLVLTGEAQASEVNSLLNAIATPVLQRLGIAGGFVLGFAPTQAEADVNNLLRLAEKVGCHQALTTLAIAGKGDAWSRLVDHMFAVFSALQQVYAKPDEWPAAVEDFWGTKTVV
ncbi:hypothetical protein MIND_01113900 [Mycena indigotica]|uniref:Uncharacterized protein n=1 Tax=Mycena indigotica TaxID=2126181 RepID=A0A8H6VVF8_9AGAR|nr:uncharacterized protein MIND_01113900 [Mycena indigotica]KAF7293371.1 hypothetical protein MIND_01113900 [Mycena indigotica]